MRNRYSFIIISLVLVLALSFADAFSEDVCLFKDERGLTSCVPYKANCTTIDGRPNLRCRMYATITYTQNAWNVAEAARSSLHVDASYIIAQALGFNPDLAYFLAAYTEATDTGDYKHITGDNKVSTDPKDTVANINGFGRLESCTGGQQYHFAAPTGELPEGYTLAQTDNLGHEPFIAHLASWVYGKRKYLCKYGLTEPKEGAIFPDPSFYTGVECMKASTFTFYVPALAWETDLDNEYVVPTGNMIIHTPTEQIDTCFDMKDAVYDDQFEEHIKASKGEVLGPNGPESVDPIIAKFGILLHHVQDVISHSDCYKVSSYVQNSEKEFRVEYGQKDCSSGIHALRHHWEMGDDELLSSTKAALYKTYEQIEDFIHYLQVEGKLSHFITAPKEIPKDELINKIYEALKVRDGGDRVRKLSALTKDGFHGVEMTPIRGWDM
eukprot:Nk52_evm42s2118 gene=Nk52_evmTU42s2118